MVAKCVHLGFSFFETIANQRQCHAIALRHSYTAIEDFMLRATRRVIGGHLVQQKSIKAICRQFNLPRKMVRKVLRSEAIPDDEDDTAYNLSTIHSRHAIR